MPYSDPDRQRAAMRAINEHRQAQLDSAAQGAGYASWRKYETAVINGRAIVAPPTKRQRAHRQQRARKEEEGK